MLPWFAALSVGRKVGVLVALVAALAALAWAVDAGIHSLKQAGRDEVLAQWNADRDARAQQKADFQVAVSAALQPQFDQLATRVGAINTRAADISVRLPQAIAAAPRYRDPNCALTAPVLEQVNAARALSGQVPQP